jgi:hypothetical protein
MSAHVSVIERNPAFLSAMAARVFNRSRVHRASRSSRITISTSDVMLCDRSDVGSEVEELAFDVFLPAISHKT